MGCYLPLFEIPKPKVFLPLIAHGIFLITRLYYLSIIISAKKTIKKMMGILPTENYSVVLGILHADFNTFDTAATNNIHIKCIFAEEF